MLGDIITNLRYIKEVQNDTLVNILNIDFLIHYINKITTIRGL